MTARTALVEQIVRLLDIRLLDPLEILLDGDDAVDAMRQVVRIRAGRWADEMLTGDDTAAVGVAARLISALYPAESVSYATAGAMLGISRQGVHDLVRRGRLPRHPDGGVPSTAIRDRLRDAGDDTAEEHL